MPDGGTVTLCADNALLDEQYAGMNIEVKSGPHVIVQVEDNGSGMTSGVLERIFEPFFTTKELGKGTGLGLSTTLAIIRSHSGSISVYSEVGVGSKLSVYLPALIQTPQEMEIDDDSELLRGNGELVLVVDDEACSAKSPARRWRFLVTV